MSTIPQSIKNAKHYIREQTSDQAVISVRANLQPGEQYEGYHAGYGDIFGPNGKGADAYSVRRLRDRRKRNLEHVPPLASANASSAMDVTFPVGSVWRRTFTPWLAARAKAGLADLQFVVGPDANGNPTYYGKDTDWKPKTGVDKNHTHISFPRDTEFGDRTSMFKAFFET